MPASPRSSRFPVQFDRHALGRDRPDGLGNRGLWSRQREVARSVWEVAQTLVPTGNMVGKSFVDAGVMLAYLAARPGGMVLATAPTNVQLSEVLIKEVERAYHGARVPLGGRLLHAPFKLDLGGGWQALAYSTTKVERFSGHHRADLLFVGDEASGIAPEIYEAARSLNPSCELLSGNPLRPDGPFYERCMAAKDGRNPLARVVQISSLESPHIDLPRSPWGLADATWLAQVRNDYGEGTAYWQSHVLGQFPGEASDALIPRAWLDAAARAVHRRAGRPRMAIDLGTGSGGDRTVIVVVDDNGVLAMESSNRWDFAMAATRAALMAQQWGVSPHDVTWDVGGPGADFLNRLQAVGLKGCRPFRGGAKADSPKFANRRTLAAWRMRQRLDPGRTVPAASVGVVPQVPFAIPPRFLAAGLREELAALRYQLAAGDRVELEAKDRLVALLRRSPDLADALMMALGG